MLTRKNLLQRKCSFRQGRLKQSRRILVNVRQYTSPHGPWMLWVMTLKLMADHMIHSPAWLIFMVVGLEKKRTRPIVDLESADPIGSIMVFCLTYIYHKD